MEDFLLYREFLFHNFIVSIDTMKSYDHKKIDAYWQDKWQSDSLYKTSELPQGKKIYVLDMFPYPSGEGLHVGHPKGYIATDIYSRFKRMNGYDVLHPMGWDAFGLPAEQFALKHKIHPRIAVENNIANFKNQLSHIGLDYDWSREINTTDPTFYKWTQWIFTKLYEKGLAYESHKPINWCPSCKTGLANEDVNHDGTCERCDTKVEKKPIRQWVLKITDYADRMLTDLDTLEWPEGVKLAQKNWIGRSEGAEFDFSLTDVKDHTDGSMSVKVFTTRADTLFGATFIAISADTAREWFNAGWETIDGVKEYVIETLEEQNKENDYSVVPEKTGVYSGINAINPATGEKIPVWIANYVLGGVGTGAIMAVPAHDERDFEFAKKYNLPVKQVISPETGVVQTNPEFRKSIVAILWDKKQNKFLSINWGKNLGGNLFIGGGVDGDEDSIICATREIKEETGYTHIRYLSKTEVIHHNYFAHSKNVGRRIEAVGLLFELIDDTQEEVSLEENEKNKFTTEWLSKQEVESKIEDALHALVYTMLVKEEIYTGDGTLISSGEHDGITSDEARNRFVEKYSGKKVIKYKMEDWVFARQRYWGEPFPVVRDNNGKVYMVDESELPVLLPEVKSYEPTGTGESPLAAITDWVNVRGYITNKGTFKQSNDGEIFTRETNTMPQWAGSSWYYLRFADPHNDAALISPEIEKNWLPVDVYVGGDHATRHLIYARFWHKFLYDIRVVSTTEPFSRLEFLGFILAEDGRKMSKRLGNVINPDDVINEYGADTFRVYEMFMAPFDQTVAWSTTSIKGADKFIDRVYSLQKKISETSTVSNMLHKTIKKVGEDIEKFKFNTAISQMMILVNAMEEGSFTHEEYSTLVTLLAPFAPHMTEQIWNELGNTTSIHKVSWPLYDESLLVEDSTTISLQINGKLRGTFVVPFGSDDSTVLEEAKILESYKKYVGELKPKKVIIIKNRLINIVI